MPTEESKPATKNCPYCGKPIETPVMRRIIDQSRNEYGKKYVRTTEMTFCSVNCGGYYQMGCEG